MSLLEKIKQELSPDESALSIEAMVLLMENQSVHLKSKEIPFTYVVLDNNLDSDDNEFDRFLRYLEINKQNFPDNTQIQLIYRTTSDDFLHWSVVNIQIHSKRLKFLLVESTNSLPTIVSTIVSIRSNCPNSEVVFCNIYTQRDFNNCAYFAANHALLLAKQPEFHSAMYALASAGQYNDFDSYSHYLQDLIASHPTRVLLGNVTQEQAIKASINLCYAEYKAVPKQYGSFFKVIQSLSTFKHDLQSQNYLCRSGQALDNYIASHTKATDDFSPPIMKNDALFYRRGKLKASTLFYIETEIREEKDCVQIIEQHHSWSHLCLDVTQNIHASPEFQ